MWVAPSCLGRRLMGALPRTGTRARPARPTGSANMLGEMRRAVDRRRAALATTTSSEKHHIGVLYGNGNTTTQRVRQGQRRPVEEFREISYVWN